MGGRRNFIFVAAVMWSAAALAGQPVWKLRHTEDFKGNRLNRNLWARIEGDPDANADWIRNISSRADLVEVKDGVLKLKGVRNDDREADPRAVLAGGVTTRGRFCMKYGKVEVRARFEGQQGAWPAIWMMPQAPVGQWPYCGEIDILEHLNFDGFVYQTVHSAWGEAHPGDPPIGGKGEIKPDSWNIYSLEWTPDMIVWRVNGKKTHSYPRVDGSRERWPWDCPFYLMMDMQLGGKWVGRVDEGTLPVAMHVDWVKFYELSIDGRRVSKFSRNAQ